MNNVIYERTNENGDRDLRSSEIVKIEVVLLEDRKAQLVWTNKKRTTILATGDRDKIIECAVKSSNEIFEKFAESVRQAMALAGLNLD
jgi:hypothetical protein